MIRAGLAGVEGIRFPNGKPAPSYLERWAGRPIGKARRAGYLLPTGRCEPRCPVPGLEARGEQWGEPVATTPRAAGDPPSGLLDTQGVADLDAHGERFFLDPVLVAEEILLIDRQGDPVGQFEAVVAAQLVDLPDEVARAAFELEL